MTKPQQPTTTTATNNDNENNKATTEQPQQPPPPQQQSFLSSMTFATTPYRDCDCDECGTTCAIPPPQIAEAVRNKRIKLLLNDAANIPFLKCQERSLVIRSDGISIWKWSLPVGAEPMIEYGNSHRIVYVDSMSQHAKIKSIGKGIIGSSDEAKTRKQVKWTEKQAYMMKSNGGKALGWSNEMIAQPQQQNNTNKNGSNDNDPSSSSSSNDKNGNNNDAPPVILYMIKITPKALLSNSTKKDFQHKTPDWVKKSFDLFNKALTTANDKNDAEASSTTDQTSINNNGVVGNGEGMKKDATSSSSSSSSDDNDLAVALDEHDCSTIQQFLPSLIASSNATT